MRMFVGITPSEEVIDSLDTFLAPRREHGDLRWSDPDQFHITLAFCADVPERSLDAFGERLTEAAARHTPFPLRLSGGGTFPDPDRAKHVYAALDLSQASSVALHSLSAATRAAATTSGIEVAGGPYKPHLTIARSGRPFSAIRWLRVLEGFGSPSWTVEEIHLVESHLGEGRERRPRYDTIETYPLGQGRLD
ncbi:MAG TPA: RNA 2',3'-cyclic phosphodiesterase [Phycicoccus sp.]|nr:RNA 2',3'-cyclic phosphodiesterase [Phycicoccus sp.]